MTISNTLSVAKESLETAIKSCRTKEDIFGENGLLQGLIRQALQAALDAELTEHIGYSKNEKTANSSRNYRNGTMKKTLIGSHGEIEIETPRDRNGSFQPQIVEKSQTRFDAFDDKIIALYARGMSSRDIQTLLKELYSVDVSPSLISRVTEAVTVDVQAWQNRRIDSVYPIVYMDCLFVKVKSDNQVVSKAVYLALGVNTLGQKELLGMWVSDNEGAKFWLGILTELQNRGLKDILIACVDGLKGFPEAIAAIFPHTKVQLCIVHQVRHSLGYTNSADRKEVATDLKALYNAPTIAAAEEALKQFSQKWDVKYPAISGSWSSKWGLLTEIFNYPMEIRKAIYTTNAIESLNMVIRKVIKNKRIFPCDSSAFKVIFLAVQAASKRGTMPIKNWGAARNFFLITFGDRLTSI